MLLTLSAWGSPTWGPVTTVHMQVREHTEGCRLELVKERGPESPQRSISHRLALSRGAPVLLASNCEADHRAYGEEVQRNGTRGKTIKSAFPLSKCKCQMKVGRVECDGRYRVTLRWLHPVTPYLLSDIVSRIEREL